MKTQNNNGILILLAVLGVAGLYYLSRKSEKQDNTYQVAIPSNEPFPAYKLPSYKSMSYSSYSDYLLDKMKRNEELVNAGVDPLTLPIQ